MDTTRQLENYEEIAGSSELPVDITDWAIDDVRQWMLEIKVDKEEANIVCNQKIVGAGLLLLEEPDLRELGLSLNARKLIVHNIGLLKKKTQQQNNVVTHTSSLKPYPFNRFNAAHRYRENTTLDVTETGTKDLIQPCHEFKAFTNTTEKDRRQKYTYELIRFAAACLNSRTNGTIHFGVSDNPHGQILGVGIPKTDEFDDQRKHAIERHFKWERNVQVAKMCIKPPRFVEVLKADMTSSGKYVIEVDIEPSSNVCEDNYFNTYEVEKKQEDQELKNENKMAEPKATGKKKNESKSFFIRDGSSTNNLITSDSTKEAEKYIAKMPQLSQLRKEAEEKHLSFVKTSVQGSKLCEMITGGTQSLDRSHFTWYIVVANKSHPVQLENLSFLLYMDLLAVLDFDPESAEHGLNSLFKKKKRKRNPHLPAEYKITGAVEDIANKLKLTKNPSWVYCNGGIKDESPSDADNWLTEKGSSVRDVVSFLCRKDVQHHKKFLVIFLLLNQESDANGPLLETFNMFLQELKGGNQILCISDNETSYTYWKDLIQGRYRFDISRRCIYELSFAEVNGTILSLWSENRKSKRFLPCFGGSKVLLETEDSFDMLSILCVNQCEGGNEDKQHHEEIFYRGGKVSWWNFYFSEQPGSMPFIKRDKFDYIVNTIIPDICNLERSCAFFNIFHLPGCGGTTLAMHVLWTLKDKFRCAVLQDSTGDYTAAAEQVVQLLTYETSEQPIRLPVLLLIDDFQDISDVKKFQLQIEEECQKQKIYSKSPQVVVVNCMRVESFEQTDDTVFMENNLSEKEQKLFEEKLKEIEKTNRNTKTFYGFMILKSNYSSTYIQGVVKSTLIGFNLQHKHAQLFAVLVLLHVYCKNAVLSVSTCEEFLGLETKADSTSCNVENGFKKFSTLLKKCTVDSKITFEGVRVIHSSIAEHCLKELSASHGVTKAEITNIVLMTELFYEYTLGKHKLMQDVHSMLVKRQSSVEAEDSLFSPLIQDIMKETPGMEETVLLNAVKCYRKDVAIPQLLARYYYIKKQNFSMAKDWAKTAKDLSGENSYMCDTVSQVYVNELKRAFREDKDDPIRPDSLDRYLTLAKTATEACKQTQQTANKEATTRLQRQKDYTTYNTAGHLCELQVAATVIEILQKTPPYKSQSELERSNTKQSNDAESEAYYQVLGRHVDFLNQHKATMKQDFIFLETFFVNLVPFFAGKDKQKEAIKHKVCKYFQQYTELFCKINWSELRNKEIMNPTNRKSLTRECLEKNRGDTYTGLLEYLYEENPSSTLEEIIQQYHFFLDPKTEDRQLMHTINFIYANVILANINPKSQYIMPYQDLRKLLLNLITCPRSLSEILPLYYISILLLWQEAHRDLPTFVSQMKASYSKELKPLSNGKRAAVHFYLGKDIGYGGLLSYRDINRCLGPGEDILTQWDNEKIWKTVRNSGKLQRVSGEIRNNLIWVANVKVMVDPMFVTQLRKGSGAHVKFFIGFSMNGPVALDIL